LSQSIFPSSTSKPIAITVKSLVFDAIGTTVVGVNGSLFP